MKWLTGVTGAGVMCLACCVLWADDYHTAENPLAPEGAARTMQVPEGFNVTLFAGEPDVVQPISFCMDDRGRLWVAEAYSYPNHSEKPGRDRILILEDIDHDGRFDTRKVFYEGLNYVTGIEVGFGGAWVMSPPYFFFIADQDGNDVPDGLEGKVRGEGVEVREKRGKEATGTLPDFPGCVVLLDGFGNHANSHNIANGFAWGPDGWLYGTHGRTNWSKIGKPGTPEDQRVVFDGGVYRYHPVTHVWEPYADGTTNPWGIDWDDYGEAFVCNCVNPHLFHVIPGAHYEPWRNRESSRYAYRRIDTIADHLHFTGIANIRDGIGSHEEDLLGGGHAHCGTMVYLGDNWPQKYRNTVFMNNIHGRRINNDILKRQGSGYTASHGADIMRSQDPWFMGVTLAYGPDGSVFVSDWSDTGECHSVKNTRRGTGRIFRIAYGTPKKPIPNPAELSDAELVELQLHQNDWYVRHARRILQERAAAGNDLSRVKTQLLEIFEENSDVTRKLRAMWSLKCIEGLSEEFLARQLDHESESVRAWAVTLLCEGHGLSAGVLSMFIAMATSEDSQLVRLHLASMLQKLPATQVWPIAEGLVSHSGDADDDNLPLMCWYGIEPLVNHDLERFAALAVNCRIPLVREHLCRRIAELSPNTKGLDLLFAQFRGMTQSRSGQGVSVDLLEGVLSGLEGQRSVVRPRSWPAAYRFFMSLEDPQVRDRAVRLALIFDDLEALQMLRAQAVDDNVEAVDRVRAVNALVNKHVSDFDTVLLDLLKSPPVRSAALRGLAEYANPGTPGLILAEYPELTLAEKQDAVQTLTSRKDWAVALLDALDEGIVKREELSAFAARQIRNLGDQSLTERVNLVWGEVRETSAERARLMADLRKKLTTEMLANANLAAGKEVFKKTCANCHKLYGEGGSIGPDITGAQRHNLDYLLENLLDPSAAVAKDYQMQVIATTSGRIVTGLPVSENDVSVTIQTLNEKVVIPLNEIEDRKQSNVSMMPDGLLQPLSFEQVRDLMGYLQK